MSSDVLSMPSTPMPSRSLPQGTDVRGLRGKARWLVVPPVCAHELLMPRKSLLFRQSPQQQSTRAQTGDR